MNKYIADTSVWIDHFAKRSSGILRPLLQRNQVFYHSLIFGELLLGGLRKNRTAMELMLCLQRAREATYDEVIQGIEILSLQRFGIGWVDACILVSARISKAEILTLDKHLEKAWKSLKAQT